eukprot:249734-Rhodomonas_salina.7
MAAWELLVGQGSPSCLAAESIHQLSSDQTRAAAVADSQEWPQSWPYRPLPSTKQGQHLVARVQVQGAVCC